MEVSLSIHFLSSPRYCSSASIDINFCSSTMALAAKKGEQGGQKAHHGVKGQGGCGGMERRLDIEGDKKSRRENTERCMFPQNTLPGDNASAEGGLKLVVRVGGGMASASPAESLVVKVSKRRENALSIACS